MSKPLLLIHGLGGNWRSWQTIVDALAAEREVIAVDLPGFGETSPLNGEVLIRTLADAVTEFVNKNNLTGIDAVGNSTTAIYSLWLTKDLTI
jgi:pimeloyl-ACP methyl ester carboxylesterase